MFLLYINDIDNNITSTIRLFADDCIIYRIVNTEDDAQYLQRDLDIISSWSDTWQMDLNIEKCVTLRCTRSRCPLKFVYKLKNRAINDVHQHRYLGILLDETMSWSPHIESMCAKAK